MIQDILPRKLYNTFVRKEPSPDSRILSFREGGALYREQDGELTFLTFRQVKEYYKKKEQELPKAVFLFSVSEGKCSGSCDRLALICVVPG